MNAKERGKRTTHLWSTIKSGWSVARTCTSSRAEITSATSGNEEKPHETANGSARQFGDVSGRAVASESTIGDTAVVGMIGCVRKNVEGAESWYAAANGREMLKVPSATHREHWSG